MTAQDGPWQSAYPQIARVLISRRQIARRVRELSGRIASRYAGKELTIVAGLTEAVRAMRPESPASCVLLRKQRDAQAEARS